MTGSNSTSDPVRSARRIRLIGLLAALAMAGAIQLYGAERARQYVYDGWQGVSPRDLGKTPVRIVWIDDQAVSENGPWPWPRRVLATLLYRISEQRPKVIGLDIMLPEADRYSPKAFVDVSPELPPELAASIARQGDTDELLADTVRSAPVVVGRAGLDAPRAKDALDPLILRPFAKPLPVGAKRWENFLANVDVIDNAGLGHGLLNGEPDKDGIVRRVPLAARVAGIDMPSLSMELALNALALEQAEPVLSGKTLEGMRFGNATVRTQPDGRVVLRLGDLPKAAQFSAYDVLAGAVPKTAMRDAVVIIGLSAAGTSDQVPTVLSPMGYGATVQANAVDTILSDAELSRPGWAWLAEGLVTVLLVFLAVRLLPRLRGWSAAAITAACFVALFGASWAAYVRLGLLLDPLGPALTATSTGVAMVLMLFSESKRRQRELAARLQEEQVASARAQGELSAARDIQLGMLPPRATLSAIDPTVEVDAFVEPARSVGGDFYDTVRIDKQRICFLVGDVTGKGVPAALFMALSKALTKSVLLRDGNDLAAAMTRLNDEVARDNSEDMFVTMLVALLDTQTGALSLCNAGHENPWLVRASGEVAMLKPEGGPPLSVAPGFVFEADTIQMLPGDALFVVSDGITEAQDRNGAFFGQERLAAILRAAPQAPVADTANSLLAEVRAFEDGQDATDDLTVLAFRYLESRP